MTIATAGDTLTYNTGDPNNPQTASLVVVVNPDGSRIGGGSGASTDRVQGPGPAGSAPAGDPVPIGAVYNSSAQTFNAGSINVLQAAVDGTLLASPRSVTPAQTDAVPNSSAIMGGIGSTGAIASLFFRIFGYIYDGSTWSRVVKSNSTARLLSAAASTNGTSVKGSAGNLFNVNGVNKAVAIRYLKFYNKATAPTVGTDVPIITREIPASSAFSLDIPKDGHFFSAGIAYAITTGQADSDTGALTAGDITSLNILYA